MTSRDFTSLGSSMFSCVANARIAYHDASEALNKWIEADPCPRACRCERRAEELRLTRFFEDAQRKRAEVEASWAEFCGIRHGRAA